jgi:hypothetical protein
VTLLTPIDAGNAPASVGRKALLKALAEVQLEAMTRFEERDAGKVSAPVPASQLLREEDDAEAASGTAPAIRRPAANGKPLAAMLPDFHAERRAGNGSMSEKTIAEHKVAVRMLEEFLGAGTPAAGITRHDILGYKRALMQTPSNYRQRFPGLTLPQLRAHRSDGPRA